MTTWINSQFPRPDFHRQVQRHYGLQDTGFPWVFDYRTNIHHTLKTKPLKRSDLDEFVACYHPENRHERKATWSQTNPEGRWRCFTYEELAKRDKLNLDIFWIKDKSLEDADSLPEPDVLAQEIADDLQTALELFGAIANELKE